MALISYAQNYEDVLLSRLFSGCASGFYIDVGACHPVVHSVTKLFYERGWQGVNIEPIPRVFEMLARDRPRDINLQVGLSNRKGTCTFHECLTAVGSSTFCAEQAEVLRRGGHQLLEHAMPVTTLARVCEQYAAGTIEFVKIDVEGHEREVLEGADFSRYRPRVVLVEATLPNANIPSHETWEPLLLASDYLFAFFDGLNRYYVRAEDRALVPLLAVPANVFDDFEIYEHRRQLEELRHACTASEESSARTQRALDVTQVELDGIRARLHATLSELETTRSELEATRAELAPFQDLGPIAIGLARRLRRMSRQSPRLGSWAKWLIRRVRACA